MTLLSELQPTRLHRAIIYGAPKTGKTLLAGKLASHFKLIWFDLENGYETLFQLPEKDQENIDLVRLPDTRSYPIAIETCLKVIKAKMTISICELHGKVACGLCTKEENPFYMFNPDAIDENTIVVFDSATQLTNSCIAHITKGESDDYKLDYDDWGNLGKLLDIFFSHVQQSKYNIIVISHEAEAKLEEKNKTRLVPVAGTRNFSRNVAKYFDEVIYAQLKNKSHKFASSTTYDNTILTGSRHNVALEDDESPTLLRIFKPEAAPAKPVIASQNTQAKTMLKGLSALKNK